jgi:hypothetical protein
LWTQIEIELFNILLYMSRLFFFNVAVICKMICNQIFHSLNLYFLIYKLKQVPGIYPWCHVFKICKVLWYLGISWMYILLKLFENPSVVHDVYMRECCAWCFSFPYLLGVCLISVKAKMTMLHFMSGNIRWDRI